MWAFILRVILYFLLAHTLLRLVRGVREASRSRPRSAPPPRGPRPPEIDPGDIVDVTYRPVDDHPEDDPT